MAGSQPGPDMWLIDRLTPWDTYSYGVRRVLVDRVTRHQHLRIVETGTHGKAMVLDGKWQSCTRDEFLYHEPLVHPAMLQHGSPTKVLILGGGEGATLREILKWTSVQRAVMVDIDGEVVEAAREFLPEMHQGAFDDPRSELVITDAATYLADQKEQGRFDVVIVDLSDPLEHGPAFKLFTREFLGQVAGTLTERGALVVQAGSVSPVDLTMHARLVATANCVLEHVWSYSSFVPSFAEPWGFVLGSNRRIESSPDAGRIDAVLASSTTSPMRMFDGRTLVGLMHQPLHIRKAIEQETRPYTSAHPPKLDGAPIGPR